MRVKLSSIISSLSGKFSGSYVRKNNSLTIISNLPHRFKSITLNQLEVIITTTRLSKSWKYLSNDQRNYYNTLANSGLNLYHSKALKILSGFNLYIQDQYHTYPFLLCSPYDFLAPYLPYYIPFFLI